MDDSYYTHDMAKGEKLLADLRREVPRMVEPNMLMCENGHRMVSNHAVVGALLGVSLDATAVTNPEEGKHSKSGLLCNELHICCEEVERCGNKTW